MTIALADGTTHENELDQLFSDMDRAQEAQRNNKMKDFESQMPSMIPQPNEEDQLQPQSHKDQNDPNAYGMSRIMKELDQHIDGITQETGNEHQIQAGPYNKDTTPVPDNRPDIYLDEFGYQRSRKRDSQLEQFNPFIDKMAKGLTEEDVNLFKRYQGIDPGKFTKEDEEKIQPFLDAFGDQVKHLPTSTSRFGANGQEVIDFTNWDGLLMDKAIKHWHSLNPGKRSEDDSLPPNARPTSQETEPSTYDKFVSHLEKARDFLEPSFIPTADQFMKADWRGKLGSVIATSLMFMTPGRGFKVTKGETPGPGSNALDFWKEGLSEYDKIHQPIIKTLQEAEKGGSQVAANLLQTYNKIENPVMRQEFAAAVKAKIKSASEGGEVSPTNISNPEIKRWTPEEDAFVKDAAKGGKIDFNNLPPELEGRSVGSILNRARDLEVIEPSARYKRQAGDTEGYEGGGSKYQDKFPDIIKHAQDGKNYAQIAKEVDMTPETLRTVIRRTPELRKVYDETPVQPSEGMQWTPREERMLIDWHNDPKADLFNAPPGIKRSPGAVDTKLEELRAQGRLKGEIGEETDIKDSPKAMAQRMKYLLKEGKTRTEIANELKISEYAVRTQKKQFLDSGELKASDIPPTSYKQAREEGRRISPPQGRTPNVMYDTSRGQKPKGPVSAPEKGSGSGGGDDMGIGAGSDEAKLRAYLGEAPKRNTELEGKSGISTPNKVPEKAANRNDNLQIDDPVMEAAIDKTWENFGRANKDNLPLISPDIEAKLHEMNPVATKKLKQFETSMDYKYKQPPGRRHWLSDLTKEEADRYRKLYNDIDKIRPVK